MSGRTAKRDRRAERLTEFILQAHDRLHKDDVEGCHELLHRAQGRNAGPAADTVAPLAHRSGFDNAFETLCRSHGVRASYVLVDPVGASGSRLLGGGDAELDAVVAKALRTSGALVRSA